jgi:hypothetical protein
VDGVFRQFETSGQPASKLGTGLTCYPRPIGQEFVKFAWLADANSIESFESVFDTVRDAFELRNPVSSIDLIRIRAETREALREHRYSVITNRVIQLNRSDLIRAMRDAILPIFFEEYPKGRVAVVWAAPFMHHHMTGLRMIEKFALQRSPDLQTAIKYAGSRKGSTALLGFNTPVQLVVPALQIALLAFFKSRYGFIAHNAVTYFFLFLFGQEREISVREDEYLEELLIPVSTIMDERYAEPRQGPARTYPLSRSRYSHTQYEAWLETFVKDLDATVRWISDITNFGKKDYPHEVDIHFAVGALRTLYMLLCLTQRIIVTDNAFQRKTDLFDVVDLHSALVTTSQKQGARIFRRLVSKEYSLTKLTQSLGTLAEPYATDLITGLADLRERATRVVRQGFIFDRADLKDEFRVGDVDGFEPRLIRTLRNAKHGYLTPGPELAIHTGYIDNDFPDLALPLLLNLLKDKSTYSLARDSVPRP